jgi:DNA-binding response OmpR family regulator
VPVIVLSAKGLTQNKIELLTLGADDYLTKPFDLQELLARINANLKRYLGKSSLSAGRVVYGDITVDKERKIVTVCGVTLSA